MFAKSFICLLAAAQVALATPVQSRTAYSIKESHNVPRRWTRRDRAPKDYTINLQIGVKQGQFDELERHLYEVSDPDHHRYGQHLSAEHVNELVKPTDEALELVHEWLRSNGVEDLNYSPSKDWIHVALPVEMVESLLDTEYHVYEHEDGTQMVRTPEWSLPIHLHEHVDAIQPTTSFLRAAPKRIGYHHSPDGYIPPAYTPPSNTSLAKICNISAVSPECFANLYDTVGYTPKVPGKNKIAFNNFLEEVPIRPDTALMLLKYRPEAVCAAYKYNFVSIDGGPTNNGTLTEYELENGIGGEANLDVQAIIGISYPTPVTAYTTGGSPPFIPDSNESENTNEPYLAWLQYVLAQKDIPQVISTSYGDDEQSVPPAYAARVCQGFAQLGARGVTLMMASGDSGVGSNDTCISNDGTNTTMFVPEFPAGCPYVTTVGATQQFEPEVSAFRYEFTDAAGKKHGEWGSGGGFSNYFPQPAYQKKVVDSYVKSLNGTYDGSYNKSGRAYPDLSAQGAYFAVVWNQTFTALSGTSASTPLMSGIVALVNDALIASGRPPLGFLNPWLYSKGHKAFTDIISGSARGCNGAGFPTAVGWDPVTGFGTPVFPKLVSLAK
ncbi:Pro-kumamolisin [Phlyctema vagabunda]|uniref:tripeptidyl-peptidase II n=1 Tax=Phlyctema vagabunda TaxID=108571 RepID=A0ABR4PC66_9HELO